MKDNQVAIHVNLSRWMSARGKSARGKSARGESASQEKFADELRLQAHKFVRGSLGKQLIRNACLTLAVPVMITIITGSVVAAVVGAALSMAAIGAGILSVSWHNARGAPSERDEKHRRAIMTAREKACPNVTRMMGEANPAWVDTFTSVNLIMRDAHVTQIGDDLALRLSDLNRAYTKAMSDAGLSDTSGISEEASAAVLTMVKEAKSVQQETRRIAKAKDDERTADVTRTFAETARAVSGIRFHPNTLPPPSTSAALQLLIGLSEKALKIDPHLVDSTGARLDDLVRQHLPRLLERHAAAARSTDLAGLPQIDDELAKGVELARSSVDDALARDARSRFDALRTEVTFLRARRGEDA